MLHISPGEPTATQTSDMSDHVERVNESENHFDALGVDRPVIDNVGDAVWDVDASSLKKIYRRVGCVCEGDLCVLCCALLFIFVFLSPFSCFNML